MTLNLTDAEVQALWRMIVEWNAGDAPSSPASDSVTKKVATAYRSIK